MFKFIVLAVLAVASVDAFWSPCSDHAGNAPSSIVSASCSGNLCTVQRGETLIADATHTFTAAHSRLDVRVTAFILGIPVNLPQSPPDDDACNSMYRGGSLVGCPTVPNAVHVWRINFFIPTTYPTFSNTRVRFELLSGGTNVLCTDVTATLL
ncbi:uncharacterized protein [Chironomus tepperi]|uniref:uncharacterized protein n=1 Tax=Chironomus tepperi TaxID=113505 RepID=UPI00391F310F